MEFVYIIYICIVRCAVSHFRLLFCEFLHHSLIKKLFTNNWPTTQREDTNCRTSLKASARTETTHGPTYSMTRAIWANRWQKGFICQMPLFALPLQPTHSGSHSSHGPTSPMATSMSMLARVPPQCRHILQSTWCARPVCMQQPYRPGMTCMLD